MSATLIQPFRAEGERLEPADPVSRHHWLLARQWVEESVNELEDDELDFRKRDSHTHELRLSATREIWAEGEMPGLERIIDEAEAPWMIGHLMAEIVTPLKGATTFVRACLAAECRRSDGSFSTAFQVSPPVGPGAISALHLGALEKT